MLALLVRQLISSRRCLAGWLAYAAALSVAYSLNAGPPLEAYQFTGALLLPVALWLTVSATVLDVPAATLFAAAVGGPGRLYALTVASGAVVGLPLIPAAVLCGVIANPAPSPGPVTAAAVLAHTVTWLAGTGAGALTSRLVLGGPARSLLAGATAAVLLLAYPAATPAGAALTGLTADTTTADRLAALLTDLLATAGLATALVLVGAVAVRRTRALTRPPT